MRRFRKKLSGEHYRWKRAESCASFKRPGFATADSKEFGFLVLNSGLRAEAFGPPQSAAGAAAVRREIIGVGATGVQKPNRVAADALGGVSNEILSALPTRGSLRRSAQNAKKKRQRERGYQQGEGGLAPNSRTLEELAPPQRTRIQAERRRFHPPRHRARRGERELPCWGRMGGSRVPQRSGNLERRRNIQGGSSAVGTDVRGTRCDAMVRSAVHLRTSPKKDRGDLRKNAAADQGASQGGGCRFGEDGHCGLRKGFD